ncbi:MAG: hypothetical protein M3O34_03740 [Chloroflexota bacterium]|nr:hypothetical protein [Chloroflexota bacterium]
MIVRRLPQNPIIRPNMDPRMGDNVNGPSLIRVPDWIERPLGRYYLYFAHHDGRYIRLAYADDLHGPWRTYEPGVLPLARSHFAGHIASPDVHVDEERRQLRLYYHGADEPSRVGGNQFSRVALSSDGLDFEARAENLGRPYMRVFRRKDWYYALAMPGVLYRSRDGLTGFEEGPTLFPSTMRHSALKLDGDRLSVFFTSVGDCPERILLSTIDLSGDWLVWRASDPLPVLEPELEYEGGQLVLEPSRRGLVMGPVRQLRDPAIYREDGRTYPLYSVVGEYGIAIGELLED